MYAERKKINYKSDRLPQPQHQNSASQKPRYASIAKTAMDKVLHITDDSANVFFLYSTLQVHCK